MNKRRNHLSHNQLWYRIFGSLPLWIDVKFEERVALYRPKTLWGVSSKDKYFQQGQLYL